MKTKIRAGIVAGVVAGAVMAMVMMVWMVLAGQSVWTTPNLIAVMWVGRGALGGLSWATALGFATHIATSALMGWIAIPFIRDLPPRRTMLAAFAYALASYPVVFATIMTWANPLMVKQTGLVPMAAGHTVFGVVLGTVYLWLRPAPRKPSSPGPSLTATRFT